MKTFWDQFAFAYDMAESLNKKAYQAMLSKIAAHIPEKARVLECAAGTGAISIAVAPKAASVLCTDLSIPMLEKARKKAKKRGLENISFAERNLLHLPEKNESFDVVIAANVIHLLDNPKEAVVELWRVTKYNGLLIIPTFLTDKSTMGFSILLRLYRLLGFRTKYSFSEAEYKRVLDNCGLPKPSIQVIKGRMPVGFAVFMRAE